MNNLLSVRQLANRYGVSKKTIKRWWKFERLLPAPDIRHPKPRWTIEFRELPR